MGVVVLARARIEMDIADLLVWYVCGAQRPQI